MAEASRSSQESSRTCALPHVGQETSSGSFSMRSTAEHWLSKSNCGLSRSSANWRSRRSWTGLLQLYWCQVSVQSIILIFLWAVKIRSYGTVSWWWNDFENVAVKKKNGGCLVAKQAGGVDRLCSSFMFLLASLLQLYRKVSGCPECSLLSLYSWPISQQTKTRQSQFFHTIIAIDQYLLSR